IKLEDRRRHCYIIGKSGTGKSTLIENMAIDDVVEGRGVVVVDPHGDLVDKVLACVPDHRIDDVIVFDPADRSYPIAFNLLDKVEDDFKGMVASGFVGIFKKIFGESWGPRLEHILRNTVLALLDFPESTMLDIPRMLTEKRFREKVVSFVTDTVIKEFWINEFAQYDAKFRTEAVSPILNKVGQFLSTATIRNIVGQPHSRINIRDIMDTQKILLINLSRGKIGEDNSALLGAMMITKIQLSAMSRADVTIDKRPDCYLYVDEFQNFATESFAVILSEARKYNLNLTIANQYITQMPEIVRDAVFGNAGTIIAFRVGGADADFLVKEFEPIFEANDLVNLDRYQIYTKLLIDGITKPAFSARTLAPVEKLSGNRDTIIETSRKNYAANRSEVEAMIVEKSRELEEELKSESEDYFANRSNPAASVDKVPDKQFERPSRPVVREAAPEKVAAVSQPVPASPVAAAAPSVSVSADPVNQLTEETAQEVPKERKARFLKWQNIIGDKIYKEQTARGGVKWFVGQKITPEMFVEQGISVDEAGSQMLKTMEKAYGVKIGTTGVTVPTEKKDDDNKPPAGGAVEVIPKPDESQPSSQPAGSAETPADAEPKTTVIPEIPEEIPADIPASYQPAQATAAKDENPLQEGVAVSL
ncbi:MAG: type IV secretion system DNA-binding domain-containing protein, partial [Candidatus Berkelbacteria bacterium]